MPSTRTTRLEIAKDALLKGRDISKLMVCPGPRGADTVRHGIRRLGRHLHWYIGEFQRRPGIAGPVQCEEVPTFCTKGEAREFLDELKRLSKLAADGRSSQHQ